MSKRPDGLPERRAQDRADRRQEERRFESAERRLGPKDRRAR